MAFDYIKTTVLKEKKYSKELIPVVSLQLKKFLTASKDERIEALKLEKAKQKVAHEETRKNVHTLTSENEKLQKILEESQIANFNQKTEIENLNNKFSDFIKNNNKEKRKRWFFYSVVGLACACCLWLGNNFLHNLLPQLSQTAIDIISKLFAICLTLIPSTKWISLQTWKPETKQLYIGLIALIVIGISQLLNDNSAGTLSNLLQITGVIALGLYLIFNKEKSE